MALFDSLVPALRGHAQWVRNYAASPSTYIEPSCSAETFDAAAAEIERLREEVAQVGRAEHLHLEEIQAQREEIERLRAANIDPTTNEPYAVGVRGVLRRWQRAEYVRLHCGEMTAQEMRTAQAVLKAIAGEVEAYLPKGDVEQKQDDAK